MLDYFEQTLLFLLAFVAVYFVYLAIRDYRTSLNIRRLSGKVRELITGQYSEEIVIKKDRDLAELAAQLNEAIYLFYVVLPSSYIHVSFIPLYASRLIIQKTKI